MPQSAPKSLPDLPCACATLRRAARLVTQLYSDEMGSEMEPTQFALLTALGVRGGASQASLARALGLDKTTMSRSLRLLQRNGWIEPAAADDGRERGYRLTRSGAKALSAAKTGWARAQERLRSALKPGQWEALSKIIGQVAEAAVAARQSHDA
jgi:DNA-binding MarR family transcriptional regulator